MHIQNALPVKSAGFAMLVSRLLLLSFLVVMLAACNSGSLTEGLESATGPNRPSQPVGQTAGIEPASPAANGTQTQAGGTLAQVETPGQTAAGQQLAALPQSNAVTFLPVSNAPQSAVTQLARSISNEASRSGVPVVASVQQGAAYQVKGYFSALEDGSGTLLVYVWDVLDRNNKRVYRINGQEQTSTRANDPWSAVTPTMLERVAQSTVSQLRSWLRTQ